MSLKTTLVLLLVLGLLGALYLVSDPARPPVKPGTGEQPLLTGISWNDVRAVKVLSLQRSTEYLFTLKADGTWWMEEPIRDLASAGWMRQLREVYEGSTRTLAFQPAEITTKVLKDTGLERPRAYVEFRTTGRELRVDIGEEDVRQDAIFVRVDGDIYRSRAALWSATQINLDDARERSCFRAGLPELTALTVVRRTTGAPETLRFEGQYTTGFKLVQPIAARCDPSVLHPLLLGILGLRVHLFPTGEVRDRKKLGLDAPAYEVTLESGRGKEVVQVGAIKPDASVAFAWIADRDLFVAVEFRELARALDMPLDMFRSRVLFPIPAAKARRIRVDAGRGAGDALVLRQVQSDGQGGHELEAPVAGAADPVAIGRLLEAIDSLVTLEFLPASFAPAAGGLEQPDLTVELTADRGASYKVRLGRVQDGTPPRICCKREDEAWVVLAAADKVADLRVHWTQLLDKRVMKLRAHEVHRVEARAGDALLHSFVRKGDKWLRQSGAASAPGSDDPEFRNLLEDRLLDLRADSVVEGRADALLKNLTPVVSLRFLSNDVASPLAVLDLYRQGDLLWARRDGTVLVFALKKLDSRNLADVLRLPPP